MTVSGNSQNRAWQRMLSGRRLDLLDPSPLDVEISDIAHGLARVARWNGQTVGDNAFSVAQHSLLVDDIFAALSKDAPNQWRMMSLLHDAAEYVIGDMISPFKAVMGGDYKLVEHRLQTAIHLRFGLPAETPLKLKKLIKKADTIAAYFEATGIAGFSQTEAAKIFGRPSGFSPETFPVTPLATTIAQQRFLERFKQLDGDQN